MIQRFIQVVAVLLIAVPAMAAAQDATVSERDQSAIQGVIQSQLAAFQRDDGVEAFSYASPGIRARFQTVENFMNMVRNGYPAVYRPREVEMLDLKVRGSTVQQEVLFVGPDGKRLPRMPGHLAYWFAWAGYLGSEAAYFEGQN